MYSCKICNIQSLNSQSQWEAHVKSGKHLSKVGSNDTPKQPVDMSFTETLADGSYKCKVCGDLSSGLIPLRDHLAGQKHLKNVTRFTGNSLPQPPSPERVVTVNPSIDVDMSCAVLKSDGITYSCLVCDDFACSGPIPMKAHLLGKPHQKKLKLKSTAISTTHTASQVEKSFEVVSLPLTIDKRIEIAMNHEVICGFEYDETFTNKTISEKAKALSPHFAFISKTEPVLNLAQFLK